MKNTSNQGVLKSISIILHGQTFRPYPRCPGLYHSGKVIVSWPLEKLEALFAAGHAIGSRRSFTVTAITDPFEAIRY